MKTIVALAPYNVQVSFNEVIINDITYWFTDDELSRAKYRTRTYRKDADPAPLQDWTFEGR